LRKVGLCGIHPLTRRYNSEMKFLHPTKGGQMKTIFLIMVMFYSSCSLANSTKSELTFKFASYVECFDYYTGNKDDDRARLMLMGMNTMVVTLAEVYEESSIHNLINHATNVVEVSRASNGTDTMFTSEKALTDVCNKLLNPSQTIIPEVQGVLNNKPTTR
ncbi:TPA: hypothetical protein I7694_22785, partial [Vibrio vulnificus]|nr:hypothetical protein [Vibrio vulnificus]